MHLQLLADVQMSTPHVTHSSVALDGHTPTASATGLQRTGSAWREPRREEGQGRTTLAFPECNRSSPSLAGKDQQPPGRQFFFFFGGGWEGRESEGGVIRRAACCHFNPWFSKGIAGATWKKKTPHQWDHGLDRRDPDKKKSPALTGRRLWLPRAPEEAGHFTSFFFFLAFIYKEISSRCEISLPSPSPSPPPNSAPPVCFFKTRPRRGGKCLVNRSAEP